MTLTVRCLSCDGHGDIAGQPCQPCRGEGYRDRSDFTDPLLEEDSDR